MFEELWLRDCIPPQLTIFMSNSQGMRNTRYNDDNGDYFDGNHDGQVFHEGPTKSHWTHPVFLEVVFFIDQYFFHSKTNNKHQIILGERLLVQPKGGDHRSDHRHRYPPLHPCSALCQEKRGESWTSSQPWASILITIFLWTSTPRSNCPGDRLFGRKEKKERRAWVLRLPGRDGKLQLKNISLDST